MRRTTAFLVLLAVSATVLLALTPGCGSNSLHEAGTSCSTDSDCAAGLSCLGIANNSGGACSTIAHSCTKSCVTSLDCLAVGLNFSCLPSCGSEGTCTQTRPLGD